MSDAHERPPIHWESIADEIASYGKEVAERISCTIKKNAPLVQKGEYRVDDLLDDVKTFWKTLGDDVGRGVDCLNQKVVRRPDVD
jgi:hypothetical protein